MALTGTGKGIQIVVGAEYKDADLKRAQRDLDKLKSQSAAAAGPMKRLGGTIKGYLGPALATAAAAAGALAIKMGVDGVQAAIADQKTVEVLAQTLENLGQAHRKAGVEEFIAALESATGVADEELRPALGLLVQATGDVDEAQRRLKQAMDLSIGTGQSFEGVVQALARSLATGTKGTLTRYGIIIDDNTLKTEGFGAALDQAAEKFKGMADREAKSLEGRLRILNTEIDNLKEAFGYGLLNALGDTEQGVGDVTDSVRDLKPAMEDLGESIGSFAKDASGLIGFLVDIKSNVDGVLDSWGQLGDLVPGFIGGIINPLQGLADHAKLTAAALTGNNKALNEALGNTAETSDDAASGVSGFGGAAGAAAPEADDLAGSVDDLEEAARQAAEEFDKLSDAISRTSAVSGYQAAIDDLRKTLKETKGETSIFNDKGRDTVDAYVDLAKNAGDYIETLDSQAQKAATARDALDTLKTQLGKTKMDPATAAALLGPFQGLIDDLEEAGLDVSDLQTQLDNLRSKTVTITVEYEFPDGRPPGGWPREWYMAKGGRVPSYFAGGGASRGSDTIPAMLTPGEFVMRRSAVKQFGADLFSQLNRGINPLAGMTPNGRGGGSGITIGQITVQSAPNERAAESLPRALRRMSFLAGANG